MLKREIDIYVYMIWMLPLNSYFAFLYIRPEVTKRRDDIIVKLTPKR